MFENYSKGWQYLFLFRWRKRVFIKQWESLICSLSTSNSIWHQREKSTNRMLLWIGWWLAMMTWVEFEYSENKERIMDRSTTYCRIRHKWTSSFNLSLAHHHSITLLADALQCQPLYLLFLEFWKMSQWQCFTLN